MSAARKVLLVGGTSEIGRAIVTRMAADGPVWPFLLGRDRQRTQAAVEELVQAGCERGEAGVVEARDVDSHERVIAEAFARADGFDVVILAVGILGGQAGLQASRAEAVEVMEVDFLGAGSLLLECLRRLQDQSRGELVVLSTVSGERPRASNAIYGAAKAGLDSLAQGLADATAGSGVKVLVVRPGFVTTRMTEGLDPAPMSTTAQQVAEATIRGLANGAHTVWVPGSLRIVFSVLRHLPRPVFRRLPL